MGFEPQKYSQGFHRQDPALQAQTGIALEKYHLRLIPTVVSEGQPYWKVIGIYHLTPDENRGNHNIFLDILGEDGQRLNSPDVLIGWTWEGRREEEPARPLRMEKPAGEAGGDIALFANQTASVWVNSTPSLPSDRVENIRTVHADEQLNGGQPGATGSQVGHHSFFVIFQRTRKTGAEPAATSGLIQGQLMGGEGYLVRLRQSDTLIAEQPVGLDETFKFESLAYGNYQLDIVDPALQQDQLQLSASQPEISLHLAVPANLTGAISFATPAPALLRLRPEFQQVNLNPDRLIGSGVPTNNLEKLVAGIWNRYGGLLLRLANTFGFEPGVAVAVLAIESGGRGFAGDGRMIIRFENHIFFDQWGKSHPEQFQQHFSFNSERHWQQHRWRPSPTETWREGHTNQTGEWAILNFARTLNDQAAKLSISMGLPQIMGFNHKRIGYNSVGEMFDAFSGSELDQLLGFFEFICGPTASAGFLPALQQRDFFTFARLYNGHGQETIYGSKLNDAFTAFQKIKPI